MSDEGKRIVGFRIPARPNERFGPEAAASLVGTTTNFHGSTGLVVAARVMELGAGLEVELEVHDSAIPPWARPGVRDVSL